MKVGDTFFIDGVEFSIKNIDSESTEKFPFGRVDASKFIGSHDDVNNPRAIQRGRPKMFGREDVAEALGETFDTTQVTSDVDMTEETKKAWTGIRTDNPSVFSSSSTDW